MKKLTAVIVIVLLSISFCTSCTPQENEDQEPTNIVDPTKVKPPTGG